MGFGKGNSNQSNLIIDMGFVINLIISNKVRFKKTRKKFWGNQ